jgi:hypothetical protein
MYDSRTNLANQVVEEVRSKGLHHAREVNRAHILLALDRKIPEATIQTLLGVGRTAIWRTRSAYCERGLDYALYDVARPGAPRDYQTDQEAKVAARLVPNRRREPNAGPFAC